MRLALLTAALLAATPALAQDDPRFCPTRPSLGESGCVTEPGHLHFEMSAVDWELDRSADQRQDTVLAGDFQARIGLTQHAELQLGWTPLGHVRTRDKATGLIDTVNGVGDVRVGIRRNLMNPDGKGLSFAVEPFVTLPIGHEGVGAGTWGAGMVVPVTYDISDKVNLALTNEVDAAPDEDGDGRHFLLNEVAGVSLAVTKQLTFVAELQYTRDDDPAGHERQWLTAGSLAWQPTKTLQLDMLVGAGLNRDAPDVRLLTGGAVLF